MYKCNKTFWLTVILLLTSIGVLMAACPQGNVSGNCRVDFADLELFALRWLDPSCTSPNCKAELDGVPGVNMFDFALLAQNWGHGQITLVMGVVFILRKIIVHADRLS